MNSDCIITQVHVPEYDVQGNLDYSQKLRLVEFGLKHLRAFNKNAYIILSGHGYRPCVDALSNCDHVIWNDKSEPLNEYGYVIGMPAQYKYVSLALKQAIKKRFDRCLKTRGDCIIGIENITSYCDQILDSENKMLLITQQTGIDRMGDCFMYGSTEMLDAVWDGRQPMHDPDGLQNTAINFKRLYGSDRPWIDLVKQYCSLRNVNTLKFMCLRWNYHKLNGLPDQVCRDLLNPGFNFNDYHWGLANGWHIFDNDGNMSGTSFLSWSEKDYYKNGVS